MFNVNPRLPAIQFPQEAAVQTQRRNAGQRFTRVQVGCTGVVARQFQRELAVGTFPQLDVILGFKACETRTHTGIFVLRDAAGVFLAFVIQGATAAQQADVVGEVAVEHAEAALVGAVVEAQRQVAGHGFFFRQVGVAQFIGAGGDVSAVGIQLVEGRGTFGVAEGGGQGPDRREGVHRAGRQAAGGEVGGFVGIGEACVAFAVRVDVGVFQAPAEAQLEALGGLHFFEDKQRAGVGIGLRHEGFFTQGREFIATDLGAHHAVERPDRQVSRFHPGFVALVLEGGAGLAAFDFHVLVVGIAGVEFDRGERALQVADFGRKGVVILLHADAHVLLGRGAVVAVVVAVGQPGVTVVPSVGTADCTTVLASVAVAEATVLAFTVVAWRCMAAAGKAGDFQVVEFPRAGVQVQGEGAVAGFQFAGAAAGGVGAAVAQFTSTVNAFDGFGGDAVVEGIDHAADGAAAIEQGGRATHDFDAVDVDRVQRHGVVIGQRRGIQRADSVAQEANAVTILATNDRPAGPRAEVRRRHTGLLVQGFTQAAFLLQGQVIAFQHGGGRSEGFAAQRVAGDDLRLQFQGVGLGGDQQGGGQRGEAPERREGHRSFLGKRQKEKAANGKGFDTL